MINTLLSLLFATADARELAAADAAALGLREPTINENTGTWRASFGEAGLVRVWNAADDAEATAAFAAWARNVTNKTLGPAPASVVADEAAGDGSGVLLLRDGNVVIFVVDPARQATALVTKLREAIR